MIEYDASRAAYLQDGIPVSDEDMLDKVDRFIESMHQRSIGAVESALDGELQLDMLERYLMRDVKDGFIATYILGRGGRNMMTQSDWGRIGQIIRTRYDFIRNFMRQCADGTVTEAQFFNRWRMYYNNMINGFWVGHQRSHIEAGFTEMRRVLNSRVPCQDCPEYAALGWQEVGTVPLPTEDCECGPNCLCTVEYR